MRGCGPLALVVAVLVPVLALLGVIEAGRQVATLAADPGLDRRCLRPHGLPTPASRRRARADQPMPELVLRRHGGGGAAARLVRRAVAAAPRPHPHQLSRRPLCRGRARHQRARGEPARRHPACLGLRRARPLLDLPGAGARATSAARRRPARTSGGCCSRIGATANVRLACQLRPKGDVEVTPLLPPFAQARDGRTPGRLRPGQRARDRDPVRRHPRLHRAFRGPAALRRGLRPQPLFRRDGPRGRSAGGRVDKFIGDGVMALFGIESGAQSRLPRGADRGAADVRAPGRAQRVAARRDRPSRCASASASMSARPSSARWAMAARRRSPRSAMRSTPRAGSRG